MGCAQVGASPHPKVLEAAKVVGDYPWPPTNTGGLSRIKRLAGKTYSRKKESNAFYVRAAVFS